MGYRRRAVSGSHALLQLEAAGPDADHPHRPPGEVQDPRPPGLRSALRGAQGPHEGQPGCHRLDEPTRPAGGCGNRLVLLRKRPWWLLEGVRLAILGLGYEAVKKDLRHAPTP